MARKPNTAKAHAATAPAKPAAPKPVSDAPAAIPAAPLPQSNAAASVAGKSGIELAAAANAWDQARTALQQAGESTATAQAALDAFASDASAEDRVAAEIVLTAAKADVVSAQALIADLTQSGQREIPQGSPTDHDRQLSAAEAAEAQRARLGEGPLEGAADGSFEPGMVASVPVPPFNVATFAQRMSEDTDELLEEIREHAAAGRGRDALAQIDEMLAAIAATKPALDVLQQKLVEVRRAIGGDDAAAGLVKCWTTSVVRHGGTEHPIGTELHVTLKSYHRLIELGDVSDEDPASQAAEPSEV